MLFIFHIGFNDKLWRLDILKSPKYSEFKGGKSYSNPLDNLDSFYCESFITVAQYDQTDEKMVVKSNRLF